jgi:hypothetical protein
MKLRHYCTRISISMLSIKECRELLDDVSKDMTDEKVLEVRDSLYELAEIVLDEYIQNPEKFEKYKSPCVQ